MHDNSHNLIQMSFRLPEVTISPREAQLARQRQILAKLDLKKTVVCGSDDFTHQIRNILSDFSHEERSITFNLDGVDFIQLMSCYEITYKTIKKRGNHGVFVASFAMSDKIKTNFKFTKFDYLVAFLTVVDWPKSVIIEINNVDRGYFKKLVEWNSKLFMSIKNPIFIR